MGLILMTVTAGLLISLKTEVTRAEKKCLQGKWELEAIETFGEIGRWK